MDILKDIGITCLTSLISIAVLFLLTKLTGSKQVSQMTMFDYIVGISIGSIAAELATDLETTAEPLTALIFYGLAAYGISVLTNKSLKLRSIFTSRPLVLLDAGVIYRENLKKARLDLNEFLTFCRMISVGMPRARASSAKGPSRKQTSCAVMLLFRCCRRLST
jgi:Predicted membrane protein